MNSRNKILELISVTAPNRAGINVFRNLDFTLCGGETAIIIGPTAAGKTTLAELIMGTMRPESGIIAVFGNRIDSINEKRMAEIRRKIGGVGGIFDIIPNLTLSENILYPLILRGEPPKVQKVKLALILAQFNLLSHKRDKALKLTREEKIMAMFARAVIADQPFLIIDEPLDRLDDQISQNIISLLKRLSVAGHTLLILTNGLIDIEISGAKRYQIKDGRLQ